MPPYRAADLPDAFHVPLEELARHHRPQSEDHAAELIRAALHEAAHVVMAGYCRASVTSVTLSRARNPRSGAFGQVRIAATMLDEEALCSLVGVAWEELNGNTAAAASDLREGSRFAEEAGDSLDSLLDEAREFVRKADKLIRYAAAGILALMPQSGVLQGRKLAQLMYWFLPLDPKAEARPRSGA